MSNTSHNQVNSIAAETKASHQELANTIRMLAIDAVNMAQSGHPGMPMGMADVFTVLYQKHLTFNPKDPHWKNRDRFVLSNGHGSMALYALNYLTGYDGLTLDDLKSFRQLQSHTAGHPEVNVYLGIETTTGPLGQGLGNAVGMALAERHMNAHLGDHAINHYVYVSVGDGCLAEGLSHEAASLAGHLKLHKLIALFDDNSITIDGSTDLSISEDPLKRFENYGWDVQRIDGHDASAIDAAIVHAKESDRPSIIACRTTIGYGSPNKAGTSAAHGSPLGLEERQQTADKLGWNSPAFEVPDHIINTWRQISKRCLAEYNHWNNQNKNLSFDVQNPMPDALKSDLDNLIKGYMQQTPTQATRKLSEEVLDTVFPHMPHIIGGSADLTGSNNTKAQGMQALTSDTYDQNYIYYGIREHGMASVMNGLALSGGVIPYGGTFLVFADYLRPALRLSALMKQRVIYVLTHDSIGLGEDGPTHQPIEHLASLRAIPNVQVMRPADGVETAKCWQVALQTADRPSVLCLTRQKVPHLPHTVSSISDVAKGAYVIQDCKGTADVTLIATGSEVSLALDTAKKLHPLHIRVISMPCCELFDQQDAAYQTEVLGSHDHLRVSIEAASTFGWDRYLGAQGLKIGINDFGASAPADKLFQHFGLTPDAISQKIQNKIYHKRI